MRKLLLISLLAVGGCDTEGGRPSVEVVDSAGVRIVEYDLIDDAPVLRLEDTPRVSLADYGEAFDHLWTFTRNSDGRILTLDRSGGARVFDARGVLISRLGNFGRGPSEFQVPRSAWWTEDGGVAVYDSRGGAVLHFSPSFEFVSRAEAPRFARRILPLPNGEILFAHEHYDSAEVGYTRDYMTVRRLDERGDSSLWAWTVAGGGRYASSRESAVQGISTPCPFTHEPLLVTAGLDVVSGVNAPRTTLAISDPDGVVTALLRRPGPRLPPPSSDQIDRAVAQYRYHVVETQWDGFDPSRCDLETVAEVSQILPGVDRDLWMARERSFPAFPAETWDLVSREGEHRAVLHLPEHFQVMEIGENEVLGVLTTELGEPIPMIFAIVEG